MNYIQQPTPNPEDILDSKIVLYMAMGRVQGTRSGIRQFRIQEEERIQLTPEEFYFMADACSCEDIERVNANYTLEDNLQQASTSVTQTDNDPVYDSDGSTE
ncbi:hypothetical protein Tco_1436430, partial [Tanacetum coccineum]